MRYSNQHNLQRVFWGEPEPRVRRDRRSPEGRRASHRGIRGHRRAARGKTPRPPRPRQSSHVQAAVQQAGGQSAPGTHVRCLPSAASQVLCAALCACQDSATVAWTFQHLSSEVGAFEAEEIGVEHLLRDIKDTVIPLERNACCPHRDRLADSVDFNAIDLICSRQY